MEESSSCDIMPTIQREGKPFSRVDREAGGDHASGLLLFPTCGKGVPIPSRLLLETHGAAPAWGCGCLVDRLAGMPYKTFMGKIDGAGEYPGPLAVTLERLLTDQSHSPPGRSPSFCPRLCRTPSQSICHPPAQRIVQPDWPGPRSSIPAPRPAGRG